MAHLHIIVILLITTSANCCDEKDCRFGTAVGAAASSTAAAVGGLVCAFTLGIGCAVAAAGTIYAAAATAGSNLCSKCSDPSIQLDKLNEIIKDQKENFQKLNKAQIKNQLENVNWFRRLSSTQKELLAGQAVLKINQKNILEDLTTLVSKSQNILSQIHMNQIISLYGDSISNLIHLRSFFNDMHKDDLGGIIDDHNSDDFIENTNHVRYGAKRNIKDVIKMLTSGHPLKRQSIWEVDYSFCKKTNVDYFSSLLLSSFLFRRIALEMEGNPMSQNEAKRFEKDLRKVVRSYEKHCGVCVDIANKESSSTCVPELCVDKNDWCAHWAKKSDCSDSYQVHNEKLSIKNCRRSCGVCGVGCIDTDNGATDGMRDGCSPYEDNLGRCGPKGDNWGDLDPNDMCCACGGGTPENTVTYKDCTINRKVKRGIDWTWGSEDHQNGKPGRGVILNCNVIAKMATVKWAGGSNSRYRTGSGNSYDLYYAV